MARCSPVLAAQILKSPSLWSNRVKVIRPLAGAPGLPPSTTDPPRAPGPARATFAGRASAGGPAPSNRAACAGRATQMPAQPRSPPAQDRRPRSPALPALRRAGVPSAPQWRGIDVSCSPPLFASRTRDAMSRRCAVRPWQAVLGRRGSLAFATLTSWLSGAVRRGRMGRFGGWSRSGRPG